MAAGGTGGLGGSKAVDLAAVQSAAAAADAAEVIASQESSEMSMVKEAPDSTNPAAATRTKKKEEKFTTLESRRKGEAAKAEKKAGSAEEKADQDLADKFSQGNSEVSAQDLRNVRDNLKEDSSSEDILELLSNKFKDSTIQSVALDYLIQTTPPSQGTLKESLIQARENLLQREGRKVTGGRNILFASQEYAEAMNTSPTGLRSLYTEVTSNVHSCEQLLTMLQSRYNQAEMGTVSSFLLRGMAADLKSDGPSVAPAKLQVMMSETRNLQAVLTSFEFFETKVSPMLDSLKAEGASISPDLNFKVVAETFHKIINDKFPSASKIERETQGIIGNDREAMSSLINLFVVALGATSPRLFASAQKRQDLKTMMLNTLDSINKDNEDYPKATDFPKPYPWS
ncbi:type III secretion system gatekeeper subunit SctW [Chlamydia sp. 17-3921]|uniref:type III secretion system gatekeeper subunit SctW n=1 Tax=Chlamydia sp. 17-3921 TaxID=2675798 RepID=UPI00191AD521|nr:type III secretion system gatekeeper subunit SctW [Chlamydia sp. 17-3921]